MTLGSAPNAVAQWCWSKRSPQSNSNYVLHPRSLLPHEKALSNYKIPRALARWRLPYLVAYKIVSGTLFNDTLCLPFYAAPNFRAYQVACPCSPAQPCHASISLLPPMNLHRTRVCRNRRQLPSNRSIESAQPHLASACILPASRFRYSTTVYQDPDVN